MVNPKIQINNLDVLIVRGKDAEAFLQGQITNDIKIIKDEKRAIYAGYCSPKGRLIAFFLIIKVWNSYFLFCPTSISNEISKKLSMYIIRSEVLLKKDDDISYFSFYGGTKEEEIVRDFWGEVSFPCNLMESTQHPNGQNTMELLSITKLAGENDRYLILGENKTIKMLYDKVFPNLGGLDSESWNASDIEAKIPNIFKETQDQFIPQSLNLDLIDAVNFKKGCYTGQEIVARTHYLGKPKRRMYLGSVNLDTIPDIGESIILGEEKVGQLINLYNKKKNLYRIIFELRIDKINSELLLLGNKISISDDEKILSSN